MKLKPRIALSFLSVLLAGALAVFGEVRVFNPSGSSSGSGSISPLTNNVDGNGFTFSNAYFVGDGSGLTNLPQYYPERRLFNGANELDVTGTNSYGGVDLDAVWISTYGGAANGFEASGCTFDSVTKKLYVAGDDGGVARMDYDGGNKEIINLRTNTTVWNATKIDIEAITQVTPGGQTLYLGCERLATATGVPAIARFDFNDPNNPAKYTAWDLSAVMAPAGSNTNLEGITFVPYADLPSWATNPAPSCTNGLFLAGRQSDGKLFLLDIPLTNTASLTPYTMTTSCVVRAWYPDLLPGGVHRADISDVFWDRNMKVLYLMYDEDGGSDTNAPDPKVSDRGHTVYAYDLESDTIQVEWSLRKGEGYDSPEGFCIDPYRKTMYICNDDNSDPLNSVYRYDMYDLPGYQEYPAIVVSAFRDPTADDDATLGFEIGSLWVNKTVGNGSFWVCQNPANGAAVWGSYSPAFVVTDSAGKQVGAYQTWDSAADFAPEGGYIDCVRAGEYNWTYSIVPSNGVTVIGHGGLTLHQTNRNEYIILPHDFTNAFSGVTFKSSYTNVGSGSMFATGVVRFDHCLFTNALNPSMAGLALNHGTANLRDTDLQGAIKQFGGASTVNDYGGNVWSSTTVGATNYYGNAGTLDGLDSTAFVQTNTLAYTQAVALAGTALQVEADTLQTVVSRGGVVTSGVVAIDAANARTNTFGGLLTVLGQRVRSGVSTTASGVGSRADGFMTTASGESSHADGFNTVASNIAAYVWQGSAGNYVESPYGSHGPGTYNVNPIGGWAGFFIGQTALTYLEALAANNAGSLTNIPAAQLTGNAPWLTASSNLSDLASVATARTNLGLGDAAQSNSTAFLPRSTDLFKATSYSDIPVWLTVPSTGGLISDYGTDVSKTIRFTAETGTNHLFAVGNELYWARPPGYTGGKLWGEFNDGTGSGLDADLLDGINSAAFVQTNDARYLATPTNAAGITAAGGMIASNLTDSSVAGYNATPFLVGSTLTVTRAMSGYILVTNPSPFTVNVNTNDWAANTVGLFALCLSQTTGTVTFAAGCTNTQTTLASPVLFLKGAFSTVFTGR